MIESNKYDAAMTYMGFRGYRPILAILNKLPVIIFHEFKDGNKTGASLQVLKEIFNLMPSGKSLFFAVGVLVYNTFVIMKNHLLPEEYKTKTIDTVRWSVINIAGKLVNHGREVILLLASNIDKLMLYRRMRDDCAVFV